MFNSLLLDNIVSHVVVTLRQLLLQPLVERLDILDELVSVVPSVALHHRPDQVRGLGCQTVRRVLLAFGEG